MVYVVCTALLLLVYMVTYGSICMFKQIKKIKNEKEDEEDDLYVYLRSREFKESFAETVKKDTWEKGLPMVYMDKDGWIVNHWKDGKIEKIKKVINI
jgi:hypothetical protein